MMDVHHFELRRRHDGPTYRFDRTSLDDGGHGYRRRDADPWILRRSGLGWTAVDNATGDVTGRPCSVPPNDRSGAPPEGDWVSRKGGESHVHELVHTLPKEHGASRAT